MKKSLGDTLKHTKSAEELDKIADHIHEPANPESEAGKPYKLSLELPTWLVKKMKTYGKSNGMTLKGIILVELLKKFEE